MDFISGEIVGFLVFFIGLCGLMVNRSIIKTILSLSVMESGIHLFYITINYAPGTVPPIGQAEGAGFVDPLPSALMLTAIVIGIGVTAIALTMFMHYNQKHGITHWLHIRDLEENEE